MALTSAPAAGPRLRVGVLGCADIAWRRTLPAMVGDPRVEIVALASRDLARASVFGQRFGGEPVQGYDRLLERDDVDAVYVPLPARMHAAWVGRSLDSGRHVLVEKPLTDDPAATRALLARARSLGLVLQENYMFLHHSQHAAVRKMLADGVVGEVRGFTSAFTIPPKPAGDIRWSDDIGGGAFVDFGGYPLRAALHLLSEDLDVVGAVFRRLRDPGVVVSGDVLLCDARGVPAHLRFGMEHSYSNCYAIAGSTGRLSLDLVFTPTESYRPLVRIERQDHREELLLAADHQFANVVAAFAQSVLDGGDRRPADAGVQRQADLVAAVLSTARVIDA